MGPAGRALGHPSLAAAVSPPRLCGKFSSPGLRPGASWRVQGASPKAEHNVRPASLALAWPSSLLLQGRRQLVVSRWTAQGKVLREGGSPHTGRAGTRETVRARVYRATSLFLVYLAALLTCGRKPFKASRSVLGGGWWRE